MPAFTVTAVDTVNDKLTAAGHGLLTGDRFRLRNIAGALPAATPALSGVTDYFAIRVDADNVKPATSQANAIAGTAVDITGAGSGTLLIEYGLPYCIRRIAAQGGQIFSIDDNEAWTSLVALHDLLTDQAQSVWSAPALNPDTRSIFPRPIQATNWAVSGSPATGTTIALASSGAGDADFCLSDHMRDGQKLKSVILWLQGDGAVDVTANVYLHDFTGGGANTNIGTGTSNNIPNTGITFLNVDVTDTPADQLHRIWLRVNANATGAKLFAIILVF